MITSYGLFLSVSVIVMYYLESNVDAVVTHASIWTLKLFQEKLAIVQLAVFYRRNILGALMNVIQWLISILLTYLVNMMMKMLYF